MFKTKIYLDQQPEIEACIKDWLETLDLDFGYGIAWDNPTIEALECRSRDGFSTHSHNCGGFDLEYIADVGSCEGSGCGPNLKGIESAIEYAYRESLAQFKEDNATELAGIADDQINYYGLYELGLSRLAEDLSELERSYMDIPVRWGVRTMYEGIDKSVHTLCIYAGGNVGEYYGAHGKGSEDLGEWVVTFKTVSGLTRQLKNLTKKVQSKF